MLAVVWLECGRVYEALKGVFGVEDQVQGSGKRRMEVLKCVWCRVRRPRANCTALCTVVFRVVRVFQGAT